MKMNRIERRSSKPRCCNKAMSKVFIRRSNSSKHEHIGFYCKLCKNAVIFRDVEL